MKGKVSVYTAMPNVARFRSRVENPSKELTSQLREILAETVAEVINSNTLNIRAKFIEKVDALGLKYKTPAHEAKVKSVVENLFDVVAATSAEKLNAILGTSADVEETDEEVPAEEACDEAPEAAEDFE